MKQKLLLCLFLLFPALASADNSGTCGENLTYTYQEATGTLSISGTGAMTDFTSYNARPWHSYCSSIQAIVIGAGVTGIDDKAFYQCTNLTSIIVEEGNTKYDSRGNCNALIETAPNTLIQGCVNTVIPSNITTIGEWAFAYNSALTNVSIPEGVTTIGAHAFMSVRWLNSVTIPSTVTSVGEQAFFGCSRLASVTSFIENPFEIDKSVFQYSDGANYFESTLVVPEGTKAKYEATPAWNMFQSIWELVDGSGTCGENLTYTFEAATGTLTISGTGAMKDGGTERDRPWFYYHQSIKVVNIEPGVTSIGNFAFTGCTSLPSINIPNSVTRIGVAAFEYCTSLTSISIPEGVTTLDSYAFRGCTGLTSISLPETITTIKNNAFDNCVGFTSVTIPNSVTSIEGGAFSNCTSLTSFNIPESVTNIGSSAFNNTGWYNNHEDGLLYLDNWLLGYKGNIPTCDVIIEKGTKGMADGAFSGCTSLTSITIPESVTTIGSSAFNGCISLISIIIPEGVTTIDDSAFKGCSSLASISIPENVSTIGGSAFRDCTSLTSISIPESVANIGRHAFYGCTSLTSITSYRRNPIEIDSRVFSNATYSTATLTIPYGATARYQSTLWNNFQNIVEMPLTDESGPCGDNLTYHFNLSSQTITITGTGAMWDTAPWYDYKEYVAVVNIESGVSHIGQNAFYGCSSLTSISIPESITTIGGSAFSGCTGLTNINIPENVTTIGSFAFSGCTSLTSIIIPDGVTTIDGGTFSGCTSLTSINIPENVTTIGNSAFNGCIGLNSFNIPESVTNIGSSAFNDTGWYNNHEDGLLYLDNWLIGYKGDIASGDVEIQEGTKGMAGGAFSRCTSLTSIIIPNSITAISASAFNRCTNLTSINIPESVTTIDITAFSGCTGLTSITIPSKVDSIGHHAFSLCTGLTSITSLIEDPYEIDAFVFSTATYSTAILYVPKNTKARYEATPAWSQFQTIEEMALAPIEETTTVELPKDSSTENVVVDNVYYNLSGDDGYDPTDDCLIINNATDTENANGDPGSDEVKENFNGIIIEVYGKGSIEIDCQTLGAMMLSVKVGDAEAQNEVMSERGTVTVDYDVTAPTYVYIYSTANAALARRVAASDNCVKLWGITVKPNIATGITDSVQMASDNKLCYSLDGRRQQNMPTKKGLYIVNGKKMIVK